MSVKRLNHVAIIVDDLQKAHDFYSGLLGLNRIERPPEVKAGGPGAWYAIGDRQLHVFVKPGTAETTDRHIGLEIDDMDELVERRSRRRDIPSRMPSALANSSGASSRGTPAAT
ncbi:MAG: VOC family protein [Candidatus Lindowbacteria bacterium]|nr:VOC family protein [Candidatus Lindowbacteria bacterium]